MKTINKTNKIGYSAVVISIISIIIISISFINPITASATETNDEPVYESNWDGKGNLDIYSDYWTQDTLGENEVNEILDYRNIKKDDVKELKIWGFNYIATNAISDFNSMTKLTIKEPKSTGIKLAHFAISSNHNLKDLYLGGVEWKNVDDTDDNNAIFNNDSLRNIDISYDNWNDYEHATRDVTTLNESICENGLHNHDGESSKIGFVFCTLKTHDSGNKHKHDKVYNFVGQDDTFFGNPTWVFAGGK